MVYSLARCGGVGIIDIVAAGIGTHQSYVASRVKINAQWPRLVRGYFVNKIRLAMTEKTKSILNDVVVAIVSSFIYGFLFEALKYFFPVFSSDLSDMLYVLVFAISSSAALFIWIFFSSRLLKQPPFSAVLAFSIWMITISRSLEAFEQYDLLWKGLIVVSVSLAAMIAVFLRLRTN